MASDTASSRHADENASLNNAQDSTETPASSVALPTITQSTEPTNLPQQLEESLAPDTSRALSQSHQAGNSSSTVQTCSPQNILANSFLEFPPEVRKLIVEMTLCDTADSYIGRRHGVSRVYLGSEHHPAPEPDSLYINNFKTLKGLLLANRQVHGEIRGWLSETRFSFSNVSGALALYREIGRKPFNGLREIEFRGGWGDSNNLTTITRSRLIPMVQKLKEIRSLSLLGFNRGHGIDGGNWTSTQVRVMLAIMNTNKNLTKAYWEADQEGVRFCKGAMGILPGEEEIRDVMIRTA